MCDLKIVSIQQATVVYLSGLLNALTVRQIEPQLVELVRSDSQIIIHMGGVEFMSSLGLWMLFSLQRQLKNRNGRLVVVELSETVKEILSQVGFSTIIQTFSSIEEGLAFLESSRSPHSG